MKKFGNMNTRGILTKGLLVALVVLLGGRLESMAQYSGIDKMIQNERYDEAMAELTKLQANDPKNEALDYRIGRIHFLKGDYGSANAAYTAGVGHGRTYPNNYIGQGAVAVKNKDFSTAQAKLTRALEVDKKKQTSTMLAMSDAWLGWEGGVQEGNEYYKSAEALLLKVTSKDPNSAPGYTKLGELYDKKGIEELAQTYFEKAIGLDASYVNGHFRLGQLKKKQEKYTEAGKHFKKALELDSDFAPALKEMAEMWFSAKQYDIATDYYNQYLEKMGDDKVARMRLGMFQYLGEQYDKAIGTLENVKADIDDIRIYRLLAYAYAKKENADADKSLSYFDTYFSKVKDKDIIPLDYQNKGKALGLKGEDSLAVLQYEKGIELAAEQGKPTPEIYMDIANMYKGKKNYAKQAEYIQKYMGTQDKFMLRETFALGRAYYMEKNYEMADTTFAMMVENKPDLYLGHLWLARALSAQDPQSAQGLAKPSYDKVLELLGKDEDTKAKYIKDYLEASRYMGAYHTLVTKDYETAIPFWELLLEKDPEDQGAQEGLKFCKQALEAGG